VALAFSIEKETIWEGIMHIYFAGNFPLMASKDKERKMCDFALENSNHYCRLLSFYYLKACHNIMEVAEEVDNDQD